MAEPGTVYLVGAGPGHPGLLTLRAVECLRLAELVLYDRLVPAELLDHAPATARRLCVDELPGCHPERWPHREHCKCAPLYEPNWWNDNGQKQWNNNCYNYACDYRSDTFAQPGEL